MARTVTEKGRAEYERVATLLGITPGELELWIASHVHWSPTEWNHVDSGRRPISPKILELYLIWRAQQTAPSEGAPRGALQLNHGPLPVSPSARQQDHRPRRRKRKAS
jgi:hypothetical protein